MAYFAMGYLSRWRVTALERDRQRAETCLEWLESRVTPGYSGACWSSRNSTQNRMFFCPAGTPTLVGSAHPARAFIEAYETLGDPGYLELARSVCEFIMNDLPKLENDGEVCLSYIPFAQVWVHNANMLGASVLVCVYKHTQEPELMDLALRAARYTVRRQRPGGSWSYGEASNLKWVDNFHTGYVLDSLLAIIEASCEGKELESGLNLSLQFFTEHFFGLDGAPYMHADRPGLVDIQGAAQCIETLVTQGRRNVELMELGSQVARWTIAHMQDADGHFYFRRYQWGVNKIAHIFWGQATMFAALAKLLEGLGAQATSAID